MCAISVKRKFICHYVIRQRELVQNVSTNANGYLLIGWTDEGNLRENFPPFRCPEKAKEEEIKLYLQKPKFYTLLRCVTMKL